MRIVIDIIALFIIIAVPTIVSAKCDAKCRAAVADSVDAEVAKLDKGDQAVIARIKSVLDTADISKLGELKVNLECDSRWQIKDTRQHELWREIVWIALNYASETECFARGLWLMLYVDKWSDRTRDERIARYNRAQYYLAARHGNNAYKCTDALH